MLRLPAESAPPCGNRRRFCRKTAQLSFYLASVYRKRRRFSPRFRQSAKKFGSFCAADAKAAQVKDRARGRNLRADTPPWRAFRDPARLWRGSGAQTAARAAGDHADGNPAARTAADRAERQGRARRAPHGRRAITQTATPPHGRQTGQAERQGRAQTVGVAGQTAELFRGVCDGACMRQPRAQTAGGRSDRKTLSRRL